MRSAIRERSPARSDEPIEDPERLLPVLGVRRLQGRLTDLERVSECHADPTGDERELGFRLNAVLKVERRTPGEILEDRRQIDLLVHTPKLVDALLEPGRDRQIVRSDDVAKIRFGVRLA